MMILDKQRQIKILISLGATRKGIYKIFMIIGLLICGIGGATGLIFGAFVVFLQSYYPFVFVPGTSIEYPMIFELKNLIIVIITLLILGTISTAWALRGLSKGRN